MKITLENAIQRFHDAGMRMTKPRESLLRLVLESNGPFSVKVLHERADQAGLDMHLATVHRNLAEFVEVGLVEKLPGEENNLYALHEDQTDSAAHVFCLDCRTMVALQGMPVQDQALSQALNERGFDASSVRMMLAAHCRQQHEENVCNNSEA